MVHFPASHRLVAIALILSLPLTAVGDDGRDSRGGAIAPQASQPQTSAPASAPDSGTPIHRIAFGSCARQDKPQPIWTAVCDAAPDLFIFLGDTIYGDTDEMAVLRSKYAQLAANPGLVRLRALCPVIGTWDDHDYGANDAGAEYPKRAESQQVMLDFYQEPPDSPRRTREGVYDSRVYGPPGRRVQVILLDTRYFRTPLRKAAQRPPGRGPFVPTDDPGATVLGEVQCAWLAEQLRVPAEVRILASSIQVLADEHGYETWGNFPRERERLLRLIRDTNAGGVIVISGDRHSAELSRLPAAVSGAPASQSGAQQATGDPFRGFGYPLFDLTSSALNQPRGASDEPNRFRQGELYFQPNFGLIQINWTLPDPLIQLENRDAAGATIIHQNVRLSELQPTRP